MASVRPRTTRTHRPPGLGLRGQAAVGASAPPRGSAGRGHRRTGRPRRGCAGSAGRDADWVCLLVTWNQTRGSATRRDDLASLAARCLFSQITRAKVTPRADCATAEAAHARRAGSVRFHRMATVIDCHTKAVVGWALRFSQRLSRDHLVLELDKDEGGLGFAADLAGAEHDPLERPPALGHQRGAPPGRPRKGV